MKSSPVSYTHLDVYKRQDLDTMYVYRIKDSKGQYVSVDKTKDINFLNFGHYTAEILSLIHIFASLS